MRKFANESHFVSNAPDGLDLPTKSGREEKRSMLHLEESSGCQKIVVYLAPSINEKP